MLNENIQVLRKSKGPSQEELALKLNVVRQTVSKWERGLSVPDAEILVALGETLDVPVSKDEARGDGPLARATCR
ncbi:helix-turn-helix domain-containing protein, partial [Collinsella sp. AF31-11]|uniref:helix-turn-helix domain-containing protein n=1 Tax=Collinsella sp. AF31-11 TaxID=2292011 RepID=UPI000FF3C07D